MEGGFSINHQFGHTVREQIVFEFVLLWHENIRDAFRVIFLLPAPHSSMRHMSRGGDPVLGARLRPDPSDLIYMHFYARWTVVRNSLRSFRERDDDCQVISHDFWTTFAEQRKRVGCDDKTG